MKNRPKLTKKVLDEVYSAFPKYIFFTTVKTGVRQCYCTACKKHFNAGINVLQRTMTHDFAVADTARHREEIRCPVCGAPVTVINTKIQNNKSDPRINLSKPIAFFFALAEDDVWVCCYFINRTYSSNGESCIDDQWETNIYHFRPGDTEYYKRGWGPYYGWGETFLRQEKFREPFTWDSGLQHIAYDYDFVYVGERKLQDTFLKYSGFEEYLHKYPNAEMLKYWCWYSLHPQIEMLSKLGHYGTVGEMMYRDTDVPKYLNWASQKPWDLYRITKQEYTVFVKIPEYNRMRALKIYKTLQVRDLHTLQLCGEIAGCLHTGIQPLTNYGYEVRKSGQDINERLKGFLALAKFCYGRFNNTYRLEKRILKYGRTVREAIKYFERISRNSVGCCWQCPGITVSEVVDLWNDYIDMGDSGKKNFNPFPSDLKGAHDMLLWQKEQKSAEQKRKSAVDLAKKLCKKYPKANKNCRDLHDKYYYDNGQYVFVTPKNIADVLLDGMVLGQCTARSDVSGNNWRYLERINSKETFIGFVRRSGQENVPWFTVEFEPCGTVRQKRAQNDSQPKVETRIVTEFLIEWQNAIRDRFDDIDRQTARSAKIKRIEEFEELRQSKKTINYGELAGTLLIEAFEKDLMEIQIDIA